MWGEESKLAPANPVSANCPCGYDVCMPSSPGQPIGMLSVCLSLFFFVLFKMGNNGLGGGEVLFHY